MYVRQGRLRSGAEALKGPIACAGAVQNEWMRGGAEGPYGFRTVHVQAMQGVPPREGERSEA
jgi:hypothetical protein